MTKDKTFQMRCDSTFMDNLNWLAKELGLSKAAAVEVAVNIYPEVVKMMLKHEQLVKDLKTNL